MDAAAYLWHKIKSLQYEWVRSRNCGCLVTWFCYPLIAKPANKTATVPWPDPNTYWQISQKLFDFKEASFDTQLRETSTIFDGKINIFVSIYNRLVLYWPTTSCISGLSFKQIVIAVSRLLHQYINVHGVYFFLTILLLPWGDRKPSSMTIIDGQRRLALALSAEAWRLIQYKGHISRYTLKQKRHHFDDIFITGCTGSCHFDYFQCSQI